MRIVVLGANGRLGRLVADELESRDHTVVRASRSTGVDAFTGEGLDAALQKADVAVDALNINTMNRDRAVDFFSTTAGNVTAAAARNGVGHLVLVSIWNAGHPDAVAASGYYAGKAAQERVLIGSDVASTIVRSTQWYELAETLLERTRVGGFAVVPHMLSRPLAAATAAHRVAEIADGPPVSSGVVLAGPERRDLHDLAVSIAEARGDRTRVLGVTPRSMRAFKRGVLLPAEDVPGIGPTFEEWLATRTVGGADAT